MILAEGLPAETYLENANRDDFEGQTAATLHPMLRGSRQDDAPYAPIRRQGAVVEAVRHALKSRIPTRLQSAS